MSSEHPRIARRLSVDERERAVMKHLGALPNRAAGDTVPGIHRALAEDGVVLAGEHVTDTVTLPVYYKVVRRLAAAGYLASVGTDEVERYALARRLHPETALTLDDLNDLVNQPPTAQIAALVAARQYLHDRLTDVIRAAARALCHVDPRDLLCEMLLDSIELHNRDIELAAALQEQGEEADHTLHRRIVAGRQDLIYLCRRILGLSHEAVSLPPTARTADKVTVDAAALSEQLARRVFGTTVIGFVAADDADVDWTRSAIAGSDGSTYPSVMHVQTGRGFVDDAGSEVVTFNNAVAYLHLEGAAKRRHRVPLYGVPLTRNAIDDPANTGMVMAPFMFRHDDLSPSEYEHMVKCATDVVQWRADAAVFSGRARAMGSGTLLPRPRVHFRDGTVTLQERESQHYQRTDAYGEMVREGVHLSSDVLRAVSDRAAGTVFAGAVKSSQLRIFTRLVNWFIAHGCRAADAAPVDPAWDLARASLLTDNETMAALLGSLVPEAGDGVYVVSCVLARPFHALTDRFRDYHYEKPGYWRDYFADLQQRQLHTPGADTWWTGLDIVDDDPYVVMMEQADYALFYIGHTYGDPRPVPPRYEFLDTLRPLDPTQAHERVQRTVRLMVSAIHRSGLGLDTDHNFLSSKTLVKIIPWVVLQAHEHCKALCRQLEREMRSLVVAHLKRLRTSRGAPEPAAEFTPVEQDAYIAHLRRADAGSIAAPPDAPPGLPPGDDADSAGATDPPEG